MWLGSWFRIPWMDQMAPIVHLSDHMSFCCDLNFAMKMFGIKAFREDVSKQKLEIEESKGNLCQDQKN